MRQQHYSLLVPRRSLRSCQRRRPLLEFWLGGKRKETEVTSTAATTGRGGDLAKIWLGFLEGTKKKKERASNDYKDEGFSNRTDNTHEEIMGNRQAKIVASASESKIDKAWKGADDQLVTLQQRAQACKCTLTCFWGI
ncbi:hypothetical protein HPP92_021232 [Vanilla planifolia]|uniref:Uncharacterized protein n=1 Tax=Vanilla planifolia TaxID=51239 RepID=A0A835PYF9_VANPL|nr:hypothetical protein HPP92_021232 [Vanilla planifolia]